MTVLYSITCVDKSYSSPTGDWMGNCDGTKLVAVEKKVPL